MTPVVVAAIVLAVGAVLSSAMLAHGLMRAARIVYGTDKTVSIQPESLYDAYRQLNPKEPKEINLPAYG